MTVLYSSTVIQVCPIQFAIIEYIKQLLANPWKLYFSWKLYFPAGERGLFDDAVRTFAKDKITASGFPTNVITEADKQGYCDGWRTFLGITVTPDEVEENPGKRFCAKIAINLLWGRYVGVR